MPPKTIDPKVKRIIQGVVNAVIPLICFILEAFAIKTVLDEHDSICTQAHENSTETQFFMLLLSAVVLIDLILCFSVFLDLSGPSRPFGVLYQACATVFCWLAVFSINTGITFCGNIAQDSFSLAMKLTTVAAVLHLIMIFVVLYQIPEEEKWYLPLLHKKWK